MGNDSHYGPIFQLPDAAWFRGYAVNSNLTLTNETDAYHGYAHVPPCCTMTTYVATWTPKPRKMIAYRVERLMSQTLECLALNKIISC